MNDDKARRRDALKWLAVARQAKVDDVTAGAYLVGLADLPAWAVEKACRQIGYTERGEYEDKWPELGKIRGVALAAMKADHERAETSRMLTAHNEPADPERLRLFLEQVKAEVARKAMGE